MMDSALSKGLSALGWYLSEEGVARCVEVCNEKGWSNTPANVVKVALNMDLRSIGGQSLPGDVIRSQTGEVQGPCVLQIQRVKNVAMPSTKQHLPSPSKRLLRLQLTDSKEYISALETDGAIDKLNPTTPPGTKLRLKGCVKVVNGFLLLTKGTVEVLGGQAEALLKKWTLNKGMTDISRNRACTTNGPPPFVPLKDYRTKNTKDERPLHKQTVEVKTPKPPQQEPEKPTRVLMDKPKERMQRKPDRKPEASMASRPPPNPPMRGRQRQSRGRQREEEDDDYQPTTKPHTEYQLADWLGKKINLDDKTSEKTTLDTRPERREETKRTTEYLNPPREDNYTSSSRGRGRRRGQSRPQAPKRDRFEPPTYTKTSHHEPKSGYIEKKSDKQSSRSKHDLRKDTKTESKEHSSKQKEGAPVVKEVWIQPPSSDNHWDWVGSAATAVPFSAKRQKN